MTLEEFGTVLEQVELPVAYHHFNEPTPLPYVVYACSGVNDLWADNRRLFKTTEGYIEFYTEFKNMDTEKRIEQILDELGVPYSWEYEEFIESEKMFVVRWSVTFIRRRDTHGK